MGLNISYPANFKNKNLPTIDYSGKFTQNINPYAKVINNNIKPATEDVIDLGLFSVTDANENGTIPEITIYEKGYTAKNSPYTNGVYDSSKADWVKNNSNKSIWSYAGQGLGYVLDNAKNIADISNGVLGWMNYAQNKKLINKKINAIDEQIAASREYRQQRRDEIARLNRVRSNTSKSFNTGSVITRSY